MGSDVALTSALRNNLLTLQDTQRSIDTTQFRLATGKKVNSALDNPLNFFRAQTFSDRASDLTTLLDGIGLSIRTIEEADNGVSAITDLLNNAESLLEQGTAAYNGTSTRVATISGLSTASGDVADATQLDAVLGGISGFTASDSITFSVTLVDGSVTSVTFAGDASLSEVVAAFTGGGALSNAGFTATLSAADGTLIIDATRTATALADTERLSITIDDSDGAATASDPQVNFGGTIVRDSSGETAVFQGIAQELENLESRFNTIRTEISAVANDSSFNGINLLKANELLTNFNQDGTSSLITVGEDLTSEGQNIAFADFSTQANLNLSVVDIDDATTAVRNFGASLATDLSVIQNRETFTRETINTLQSGADDLTLADLNEEGANLLALQTRQQLGVTALSLAGQANQSVLRLF